MPDAPSGAAAPGAAAPRAPSRWRGPVLEIVETLVLTVLIFLGIQTFVAQPFQVKQGSMETTLLEDQFVLVDKLTPRWADYARGDIVVFDAPEGWDKPGTRLIKRVIGLPGDDVELRDGIVFVNGKALDEPYIHRQGGVADRTDPTGRGSQWTVPEGDLFVLGDHRGASADSRRFGPIEIAHVVGRAWLRYWPLDAFGALTTPSQAP